MQRGERTRCPGDTGVMPAANITRFVGRGEGFVNPETGEILAASY